MWCAMLKTVTDMLPGLQIAITRPQVLTAEEQVDEAVFQQAFIPRKLDEVEHFERDSERLGRGENKDIYFQTLTGMASDGTGAGVTPKVLLNAAANSRDSPASVAGEGDFEASSASACSAELVDEGAPLPGVPRKLGRVDEAASGEGGSDSDSGDASGSNSEAGDEDLWEDRPVVSTEDAKEARKANKKAVKELQREKRLTKLPKKAKKRAEKKGKVKK